MIHNEEVDRRSEPVKTRGVRRFATLVVGVFLMPLLLVGCEDDGVEPVELAFGQVGEIRVEVRSLLGDRGELNEILIWLSNGPWLLTERVGYRGNGGAENFRSSQLNPGDLAREYASLIRQLNQTRGLALFGEEVPRGLDPECATEEDLENPSRPGDDLPDTRVVVTIRDTQRNETARWVRCAEGTLLGTGNTIVPSEAAPLGTGAERVVTAAQLTRFFTLEDNAPSTYKGTVPFAAISQGQDSPARPQGPEAFVSNTGQPPSDFVAFWRDHAGPGAPLPPVDWSSELVLLAAVGERSEAGDLVRVKRVEGLGPQVGTRVQLEERVPGDFCSPAALRSHPYQIVVVPRARLHLPVEFTPPAIKRIPCDG